LIVDNFKAGVNFQLPLFLRKERGDLKLAKIKLQETQFENEVAKVTIKNQVSAVQQELSSFVTQTNFINGIVRDYTTLLNAEDRKFFMGESSLFLVNSRESKLIESKLKAIDIQNLFLKTKSKLFKAAVISITE
jgi:outer membrane protein TolC